MRLDDVEGAAVLRALKIAAWHERRIGEADRANLLDDFRWKLQDRYVFDHPTGVAKRLWCLEVEQLLAPDKD